jgi:hypothetical protein
MSTSEYSKDLIGPSENDPFIQAVTPEIEKTAEGSEGSQARIERNKIGITAHTKVGDVGLTQTKSKNYNPGAPELLQSDTRINYSKNFEVGEGGNLNIYGSKGINKSEYSGHGDSKKQQGTFSLGAKFTHRFNHGGEVEVGKGKDYIKDLI